MSGMRDAEIEILKNQVAIMRMLEMIAENMGIATDREVVNALYTRIENTEGVMPIPLSR